MEKRRKSAALLPVGVFLIFYLGLGILFEYIMKIPMGFYNVPIVVAFLAALLVACLQNTWWPTCWERRRTPMSYDVLVIGGGPAGLSASINVRARGRSALVVSNPLEENPLWRAEKVDNYLGLPGLSGAEMLAAMRRHAEQAGVEFLATSLD